MKAASISHAPGQASLSVTTLLECGIHSFQTRHYGEGEALLSLVNHYLSPELAPLSAFLDTIVQECRKYTNLHSQLYTLGVQYAEVSQELKACMEILLALEPQLLEESQKFFNMPNDQLLPEKSATPSQSFYAVCLRSFELQRDNIPVSLCLNRNGQAILRYLIVQPDRRASIDTLMGLFWPEDPEEVASHKLHIAVSTLRQSLQTPEQPHQKYVLYKQRTYYLDPKVTWRSDTEEFLAFYNMGRKIGGRAAIPCYEKACKLYTRPFLLEDLFSDWSFLHRKHLSQVFEEMCHILSSFYLEDQNYEAASYWALKILAANNCDEAAYRLLMSIYAREGKRHEALQLYFRCQRILQEELNVSLMPETEILYQSILNGDHAKAFAG